jgi:diguanylate cyclase (GGDEF)-like protein
MSAAEEHAHIPKYTYAHPSYLCIFFFTAALYASPMTPLRGSLHPDASSERLQTAEHQREIWADKLELMRARQLLASSLDALGVGLEIWDEQDRLVLYNKKVNHLQNCSFMPDDIGKTHLALGRTVLDYMEGEKEGPGNEETLSGLPHIPTGLHGEPKLQRLPGDHWTNTYEAMTPEGYLIVVRVNVTELVRQGRMLEASNHQLAIQSATDSLTGLPNRRCFDEVLTTEWQRASRSGATLSLLMVDIDHFKKYNDHYGHLAGDQCLRRVAGVLGRCVRRAGELVARYGGEEFILLLPAADMAYACETAQKCLSLMQLEAIRHAGSPTGTEVTLSIGVACLQPDATLNASTLIDAADAAMYRAKSGGRARYEAATQSDWEIDQETPRTRPSPFN